MLLCREVSSSKSTSPEQFLKAVGSSAVLSTNSKIIFYFCKNNTKNSGSFEISRRPPT
ncbi:unnamed protein product [Oikopleura dioica]|uniref:Uncharacterized protein n=1 Tax=Oikopleura dioica TaxID=34765 RepID=E4Y0F2_OIKDI|nr:unnamed protein product [Oikopleura dioica]